MSYSHKNRIHAVQLIKTGFISVIIKGYLLKMFFAEVLFTLDKNLLLINMTSFFIFQSDC